MLRRVPGASNVYPEQVTSGQYLNIVIDRAAAARYGIGVGDIQEVIETAIGETVLTTTIEGRAALPGPRALRAGVRADPQALGRDAGRGARRRADSARRSWRASSTARGPAMIASENGLLLATVLLNVQGRDVGGFVEEARATVARGVSAAAGLLRRVERPLGEPGARAAAAAGRRCRSSCWSSSSCCTSPTARRWKPRTCCWPCRSR